MAQAKQRALSLSAKESLVLALLIREPDMYGLELVAASRRRLKRGTVYVTLGRMEEKGYIVSRLDDQPPTGGGLPRRRYQPTALGRRVLELLSDPVAVLLPEPSR